MFLRKIIFLMIFMSSIFYSYGANCGGDIECNCGDILNASYILKQDLVCNGSGLTIGKSNINLDCNGYKIEGNGTGVGIYNKVKDYITIENCNIENFNKGIENTYSRIYVSYDAPRNNTIKNNTFINNSYGIHSTDSYFETIINNIFINNHNFGIYLDTKSSNVWNNTFNGTGVYSKTTASKIFCINGVGNQYFHGALGPSCNCIPLQNNIEIDSNPIICADNYSLPNGIKILHNGNLDCNGSTLNGNGNNIGILNEGRKNTQIKNCNIENYNIGIKLDEGKEENYYPGLGFYYNTIYTNNTNISNNNISFNIIGIQTKKSTLTYISGNKFENNIDKNVFLNDNSVYVWNNNFSDHLPHYSNTRGKKFCYDNMINIYPENETKIPQCDCLIPFTDLYVDSDTKLCPGEYELSNGFFMGDNGILDCQGAILNGPGNKDGILNEGRKNTVIKNCVIKNFENGISFEPGPKNNYYPTRNLVAYANPTYSINNTISNNNFQNNKIGIYDRYKLSNFFVFNNIFEDNTQMSISINKDSIVEIGLNSFYDYSPSFPNTKGKKFCYENSSNFYFNGLIGPLCECIVPRGGLIIDSNTTLCKGAHILNTELIVSGNAFLNCNGSVLKGNGRAILAKGAVNSQIANCDFKEFNTGIEYISNRVSNYYGWNTIYSKNNEVLNSTFVDVNNAIINTAYGKVENIHNNEFLAERYNIYNGNDDFVNATNNYWGTDDTAEIESKLYKKENIVYEPFIQTLSGLDLSISSQDIMFDNHGTIRLDIKNLNKTPELEFEVGILDVYDQSVKRKDIMRVSSDYDEVIEINVDWKIDNGHQLQVIIDPENELNDENKINNYAKRTFTRKPLMYLETNLSPLVAKLEIENFIKKSLGEEFFVNDEDMAEVIIFVGDPIKTDYESYNLNFDYIDNYLDKTDLYTGEILSYLNDSKIVVEILSSGIDGKLVGVKFFSEDSSYFLEGNNFTIDKYNVEAIQIYDFLHSANNLINYNYNIDAFRNNVHNVLYDNQFFVKDMEIPVDFENGTINYKMRRLMPENSVEYREFINKDLYPIVMGGGLWSDITTWQELGGELANEGYEVYLIELTGGESSECVDCYNYPYEFLTDEVYPAYIEEVLEESEQDKIKYIGHSNGARVPLDSLTKGEVNPEIVDTFVAVGVPGAFEELSLFGQVIKLYGENTLNSFEEKKIEHATISEITNEMAKFQMFHYNEDDIVLLSFAKLLHLAGNKKISSNLFGEYYNWINSTIDEQPGKNLKLEHFTLIYGDVPGFDKNDVIVSVIDENKIFENIDSQDKYIFETNALHTGMSEDTKIKKIIYNLLYNN